ncbi:PadR family transcriptional regulator [Salinigranum rubrum]|uniref:PadR family transcriptional regulator n=1 Tax=Salinigranum rubrum TaxID=755307 RepID=A0A2I8VLH2_9EURY|nr:helix-turn-helix transcriptional regulator [Salinigranum rubrum]AUV82783.1 PadR family transcriptional regulator [Salinigranum rubrum]
MSLFQLTGFQRDLMFVIADLDQPSGQAIKERLEEELGIETNHGRLYPNLDTLVEEGFVERGNLDRRTNYYVLSDAGRQALVERREWEDRALRHVE